MKKDTSAPICSTALRVVTIDIPPLRDRREDIRCWQNSSRVLLPNVTAYRQDR